MLREDVERYIANGHPRELEALIAACEAEGGPEGLVCLTRLFEDMYGGITYNFELKAPAAWALASWGEQGLDQLMASTLQNPTSKNVSLLMTTLTTLAANRPLSELKIPFIGEARRELLESRRSNTNLAIHARRKLVEFILAVEDEEDLVEMVGVGFRNASMSLEGTPQAKELLAAISTRWLAISEPLLARYENLIRESPEDEAAFQQFFTEHPEMLDPLAVEIYPHPNLHGAYVPDFVVRRFDDSYVVVEIETPAKQLVTGGNQISALATQAVTQVTEYRRFLERLPTVETHFPRLDHVACLVVVGLNRDLNPRQQQALRNENRERPGVQIVGFDWLAQRAVALRGNLIRAGVEVRQVRVI